MYQIVLLRHGESVWNKENLFTGWTDVDLTEKGREKAKQAGIFEMRGLPADQFDPVLGIVCPGIVYPYLRANVADLLTRTGLPPIHLAEINFEALYQQKTGQSAPSAAGLIIPPSSQTRQ